VGDVVKMCRLQIGQYHLKSHMFSIDMGGCDIVLGVKWLHTLGPILMDFKDLTMQFQQEGQQYKFQGITTGSPEIISSHHMENLLKKGHSGIISQLHSIHVVETPSVHPTSNLSSPTTKLFLPLPKNFPLPVESMIIPFLSYRKSSSQCSPLSSSLCPRRMKLRKLFMNF
jgi:hypothetical protein